MAKSTTFRAIGGILMGSGAIAIPFGLELGERITPFQADLIAIGGVSALAVGIALWLIGNHFKRIENDALVQNIPALLADMDIRREEIIQNELDKRMGSADINFAFNILRDVYATLVGNNFPELPTSLESLIEYSYEAKDAIKKMQEQMAKKGEKETGLLVARSVNRYLSIDDEVENDRIYKKLKNKLKTAREHLPSAVASNATTAIDNYLDVSKSYKAPVIVIVPLAKMLEENDLLRSEPLVAQIIDIFQSYREQYVKLMNDNLAKVNEALGEL